MPLEDRGAATPESGGSVNPGTDAERTQPAEPTEPTERTEPNGSAWTEAEPADAEAKPAGPEAEPANSEAEPVDAEAPAEPVNAEAAPAGGFAARPPRTVSIAIGEALRTAGVRYAFGVPGEPFLLEGLDAAGIRVVATGHEGAAAFMAEAHGQLTGRPAVCLGAGAAGAASLAVGIHTAYANSTPTFVLVGSVERAARGREAFREIDLVGTVGRLAKWSAELTDPTDVLAILADASDQAVSGRPGPVVLGIPEDLLDEPVPDGARPAPIRAGRQAGVADDDVRAVLQLLASAERPVILAGGGVLRARCSKDLVRFADLLHVPVIAAWHRGDVVPNDHPLYLGSAGPGAPPVVRQRLAAADAMLVLGCRLNELTSYRWTIPAGGTPWAHVDAAAVRPSRDLPGADLAVEADTKAFLRAAISRLERAVLDAGLVHARDEANRADRAAWEAETAADRLPWSGPSVHPGRIMATLDRVLPETAILTTDAGSIAGWASRGFRFRRPGTYLGPTSDVTGYGLPAAIAAALVHRDRPVVALIGDRGLGATLAELETAVREAVRVIPIVFDNQDAKIREDQRRRAGEVGRPAQPWPIDVAALARACGAHGIRIETDEAFEPALRQALVADAPTVIHLIVDPALATIEQATARLISG